MARVLAIEDEPDVLETLRYDLTQSGHHVRAAPSGVDGLRAARSERPDVVLLDLMLPDGDGLDVARALRSDPATRDVAIVIVSAKHEEEERVAGFEAGADDYVTKPFSLRELRLRIEAVLRRRERAPGTQLRLGALRIDEGAHRAWLEGERLDLTPLEFKLLVALVSSGGAVIRRADLLRDVWGSDGEDPSRTIDQHVKRLRAKLGDAARFVETVRGVGYRFVQRP